MKKGNSKPLKAQINYLNELTNNKYNKELIDKLNNNSISYLLNVWEQVDHRILSGKVYNFDNLRNALNRLEICEIECFGMKVSFL